MLRIDLNAPPSHPMVEATWKQMRMPCVCGILTGDGTVLLMEEHSHHEDGHYRSQTRPLCETTIDSLCEYGTQFVELIDYVRQPPIPGTTARAVCGEGSMGSEGFVAIVNDHGLVWAIFLSASNPFSEVNIVGDRVEAMSTHGVLWRFPIYRPWEIELTYTIDWRKVGPANPRVSPEDAS